MHSHSLSLPQYARACIAESLGGPTVTRPSGEIFDSHVGAFVTLWHPNGSLQGCIGNIEPNGALADSIKRNALHAAFRDPRAARISIDDVKYLGVEVSVLSPLERVYFFDEASAKAALRPTIDGVVLRCRDHQGTFLPQVWDSLPDVDDFVSQLKRKAGLPSDYWSPAIELWRYTVEKYHDGPVPDERTSNKSS